jgi:peptidoglycan-N-acetylglucosamine deacetylase
LLKDESGPRQPTHTWSLLRLGWAKRGRAVGVLSVWVFVEHLTARLHRIRQLGPQAILRYALERYRGERVVLDDGTVIASGDQIIELHFDNHRLVELSQAGTSPWPFLQHARDDLAELERLLSSGAIANVKALHGLTLFAPAGMRLGFEVRSLPRTWRFALERFFLAGLVVLYHPAGWKAAARHAPRWPGEIWMSRATLARRYRAEGAPTKARA